jgi:DNA-directed RNA polymerase subunit M/transcription elongation factor TFIIS
MKFCGVCQNMLFLQLQEGALQYNCKHCGTTAEAPDSTSQCVIDNNYVDDFHKQYLSPYIAYDPTLPRTSAIACANKSCTRPREKSAEVIIVKYDHANMKFLYYCCHCGTFWKTKT